MFLRTLSLRGFKSFAEKTSLEFMPGISVIVGPNGSGKSNLVDAISWVLGEQGPRALRGGQMADVIFAGSPARPALGLAEVRLVIDNSAGLIPVPLSEIEISRTIFRSGESEYRIGGKVARLLDLQELLSDTGIGRALHTVVGQGQLEDVLTARPEERRRYIEEAAGIAKHKRRRERAERKLAGLDQDLLRLQDVLRELRRQLKPLQEQAATARRHEDLTTEAGDLAWRVAAARLRDLYRERDQRRSGWDEGEARRDRGRAQLASLDRSLGDLASGRAKAAEALTRAEQLLAEAGERKGAAEAALRDAVDRESRARSTVAAGAARGARLAQLDEEIARLETSEAEVASSLEREERSLAAAERSYREAEQAHRRAEEERRRLAEELAGRRAALDAHRRSLAAAEPERHRVATSLEETRARVRALAAERDGLEMEIERLDAAETPLTRRRDRLEVDRRRQAAEVSRLRETVREHEARRELLEARRRDLEETAGTRFLASHGRASLGLLREFIRAPAGLERALAAALGSMGDAVVYEDADRALAEAGQGEGATLALADPGDQPAGGVVDHDLAGDRALVAEVTVDPRVLPLVKVLLRDVYVVRDLDEAAWRHRRSPRASFVTEEGVLVGPAMIRTTGATDARAEGIRRELLAVARDVAATRAALRPGTERLEEVTAEAGRLSEELERIDGLITAAAERMGRLDSELSSLRKEDEMLAGRLGALDGAVSAAREALADAEPVAPLPPELPPAPGHPVEQAVEVETLRRERSRIDKALARARRERRVLAGEDPDAAARDLSIAEEARRGAEARLREAEAQVAELALARAAAATADREATAAESEANREWREAAGILERLREEYEQEDRAREDLERRMREAERLLSEGHGREPNDAVVAIGADDSVEALERRSELVARRLSLLGRVNLLAGGEFEAIQERHDFLARELEDVKKARRDLLELVRRIDEHVVALFDRAFRDVAAEFERLFGDLFPDGEGRLVLTDPADLLGSGIELEARPGRKRVKRISLLSGGERALSALAFLFAIFRARPSPFYLLDEVEAALDDVNLSRFLRLIRGFAETSQVLVVTHQKRTMEAADILYGISMGRDGSSAVISQRMTPEAVPEPESVGIGRSEPAPGVVR